jgi:hypothetical protein
VVVNASTRAWLMAADFLKDRAHYSYSARAARAIRKNISMGLEERV